VDYSVRDFNGLIFKILNILLYHFKQFFYTKYCKFTARIRNVKVEKKTTFIGRTFFYRKPGSHISIGHNCHFTSNYTTNLIGVNRRCIVATHLLGATIVIGDNCGFSGTVLGAFKDITIGNNVRCGANTLITDSNWHNDDPRAGQPSPIKIEDNVWLGVNVVVLKGVTIGKNSVIGANSLVTKNIPPNVIAGGNPCHIIRELEKHEIPT
jgi:acetyltransferase-like isoleucine patch superfamily enzyme